MLLSNVLLRICWNRPDPGQHSAASFVAETTDGYVIPRFHDGFEVVGNDQHGTAATQFILPDGSIFLEPGGTIGSLFDRVATSGVVDVVSANELHAWVFVEGNVVMRGVQSAESYSVVRVGDVLYSDNPRNVLILNWLRFLSETELQDLESHMGQP